MLLPIPTPSRIESRWEAHYMVCHPTAKVLFSYVCPFVCFSICHFLGGFAVGVFWVHICCLMLSFGTYNCRSAACLGNVDNLVQEAYPCLCNVSYFLVRCISLNGVHVPCIIMQYYNEIAELCSLMGNTISKWAYLWFKFINISLVWDNMTRACVFDTCSDWPRE